MTRILIADDTKELLFFLEYLFHQNGFDVITASSGAEAVRLTKETRPDLLLVDAMMPGMNGLEVCRQVRTELKMTKVPILLYSAAVGEEIRKEAIKAGADEFLGKTLHHSELLAKVQDWLNARSSLDEGL